MSDMRAVRRSASLAAFSRAPKHFGTDAATDLTMPRIWTIYPSRGPT